MTKMFVRALAALMLLTAVLLPVSSSTVATAATVPTYGDYSLMFVNSAGQYWSGDQAGGKWQWAPQSATESHIYWGAPWSPGSPPPSYHEKFVHETDLSGDWVRLYGWYDNGTFYTVHTTTEWQAAADCRTGRTYLPTGGAQHYVYWNVLPTSYCLYAEGSVKEESSGKLTHFIHQQVYTPPAACGTNAYGLTSSSCITQWESWSDDNGTALSLKLERTATLAQGLGMAFRIRQTFPSVWSADLRYQRTCSSFC